MILPACTFRSPAGLRDDDVSILSANGQAHFQYVQLGISKQWLPYGKTTFYADYGLYKNFNVGNLLRADLVNPGELVIWGTLAETEVRRWGSEPSSLSIRRGYCCTRKHTTIRHRLSAFHATLSLPRLQTRAVVIPTIWRSCQQSHGLHS
jgi:hypothetical protein